MLNIKEDQRVVVWKPRKCDWAKNTFLANVSSSRKNKENDTYDYMHWNAKFVGSECVDKAYELKERDVIVIKSAAFEQHFDKEKNKEYINLVIFDFEKYEKESASESAPKEDKKDADFEPVPEDEDMPF